MTSPTPEDIDRAMRIADDASAGLITCEGMRVGRGWHIAADDLNLHIRDNIDHLVTRGLARVHEAAAGAVIVELGHFPPASGDEA